jgi:hypothetical protein
MNLDIGRKLSLSWSLSPSHHPAKIKDRNEMLLSNDEVSYKTGRWIDSGL